MTIQLLYSVLSNLDVIIVKNDKDIFNGIADNIPIVLMDEWIDSLKIDHDQLVIILQ